MSRGEWLGWTFGLCAMLAVLQISGHFLAPAEPSARVSPSHDRSYRRYRFPAHLSDGHMMVDEGGETLLFESRKAAKEYVDQYERNLD